MLPIKNHKSLIEIVIERTKNIDGIDHFCIATSKEKSDDFLVSKLKTLGVSIYRGSLNNVLNRAWGASQKFNYNSFLRICADRPLFDPELYSDLVEIHKKSNNDLTTNIFPRSVPEGLSGEIIKVKALNELVSRVSKSNEKEHITKHFYNNVKNFTVQNIDQSNSQIPINYKLTIDNKEDYKKIIWIYKNLNENEIYDSKKIMELNIKWINKKLKN